MKKIKIAQIGTSQNSHGTDIWKTLIKLPDVFEIVGYALPQNERQLFPNKMKAFEGYREMTVDEILSDPEIEAVAVETQEPYLTKYAIMVAKAGKHLHMEKPGGMCLDEFKELISILKENNLVFSTGYMYRFNPMVRAALDKIKRGELGKIYSVEAQMNCTHDKALRDWLASFPGGMLFFLGCHLIDLVYQIQGEPCGVIPLSCSTGIDGVNSMDCGMAVFKYPSGVSFIKACDVERGGFERRQLVICGEKGTIEIKPLEVVVHGGQVARSREVYDLEWYQPHPEVESEIYDRYIDMIRNFAELIHGKENPYSYDYELGLYELILKACGKEN
jgi:predicted dehydrogenase